MDKKLKEFTYIFSVIVMLLFVQCTSNDKRLHKELSKMATNLNRSAPTALDQHTRFDSVAVTSDNIFQYYYTITNIENPRELLQEQKDEMIENIEKAFATDRSLQIFVKNSVTMEYIYRDISQKVIDTITIDASTYNK
jgi:hypothetical protein